MLLSLRSRCFALVVLGAGLPACEKASDEGGSDAGAGGQAVGGSAGQGGTGGLGGTSAGIGGAAAGSSASGGAAAGRAGEATGGASGAAQAGRAGAGGAAGAGGSAGRAAGGQAGSTLAGGGGGRGGEAASAGDSTLAGAGGEADGPSSCPNPLDTVDVSNLDTSEAFEPYVVSGNTANQIRQSINQNRDSDYDAYTSWYLSWQFGDCEGNGLVITADLTYIYPEWDQPTGAAPDLVTSWETYMDALFCHEYGHAKNGLDCANEVYAALSAIDAGGDCGAQQSEAEATFDSILSDCQARDVKYDADTDHGATMGAVFPP
jgi:predicted secreted Zn-dependent protease